MKNKIMKKRRADWEKQRKRRDEKKERNMLKRKDAEVASFLEIHDYLNWGLDHYITTDMLIKAGLATIPQNKIIDIPTFA